MLHLPHLEMIDELLRKAPALATRLERVEPGAAVAVHGWLLAIEELLNNTRLGNAARFAALRVTMTHEPEGERRGNRRRAEANRARVALAQGVELLESMVAADRERLRVAEEVALAIVVEALGHGVAVAAAPSHEAMLRGFWSQASTHPAIAQLARQLVARTGPTDALALVDRALSRR